MQRFSVAILGSNRLRTYPNQSTVLSTCCFLIYILLGPFWTVSTLLGSWENTSDYQPRRHSLSLTFQEARDYYTWIIRFSLLRGTYLWKWIVISSWIFAFFSEVESFRTLCKIISCIYPEILSGLFSSWAPLSWAHVIQHCAGVWISTCCPLGLSLCWLPSLLESVQIHFRTGTNEIESISTTRIKGHDP